MARLIRLVRLSLLASVIAAVVLLAAGCSAESRKSRAMSAADRYYANGEYEKAEIEYLNVLKVEPLNGPAIGRLGLLYAEQGRTRRAVAYLLKGKELNPENLDLRLKVGQLNLQAGKTAEGIADIQHVLDRRPLDPDAPLMLAMSATTKADGEAARLRLESLPAGSPAVQVALGMILMKSGNAEEAKTHFRKATELDAKFAPAWASLGGVELAAGHNQEAAKLLKRAVDLSPPRSPLQLQYAQIQARLGDRRAAKAHLESLSQRVPDYVPVWIALAEIAFAEKDLNQGEKLIGNALARDPDNLDAQLLWGRLRIADGKPAEAVVRLEKLANEFPKLVLIQHELARAHLANGDLDQAIEVLSQARTSSPSHQETALLLAELLQRRGDFGRAITVLRALLQDRPDLTAAWLMLGQTLRSQGNFDEALAIYARLIERQPKSPEILLQQSLTYVRSGRVDAARNGFEQVLAIAPENAVALEQLVNLDLGAKQPDVARRRVDPWLPANGRLGAIAQLLLAKIAMVQGQLDAAEAALKKAIELQPDSGNAYFVLANLLLQTGRQDPAIKNFESAIAHNPRNTSALMMLGMLHDQRGDHEKARENYEKVIAIDGRNPIALNNLAYLYAERLGNLEKAAQMAQRAREVAPNDPNVADTLGWIRFRRQQYASAVPVLQEAAEKSPNVAEIQYHLGQAYYMTDREDAARAALSRALTLNDQFAAANDARLSLNALNLQLESPGARTAVEKLLLARGGDPVATLRLGLIEEREGNLPRAREILEQLRKSQPSNVSALIAMSRIEANTKNYTKALELARTARQLSGGDAERSRVLAQIAAQAGDFAWSASLLEEATRVGIQTPELLLDLANSRYKSGRVAGAVEALAKAISAEPTFLRAAEAKSLLAAINFSLAPTSASSIERSRRPDSQSLAEFMAWAREREEKRDFAAAAQAYEEAISAFPQFSWARVRLAILNTKTPPDSDGREIKPDPSAYDALMQARADNPSDSEVARYLGSQCFRKGDFARAVALLTEASGSLTRDAELYYYLGLANVSSGQRSPGKTALARAQQLGLPPRMDAFARSQQ